MNISLTTKAIVGKQEKINGLFNQENISKDYFDNLLERSWKIRRYYF